ncbi:ABC transporter permease subunit [Streptomyces aidingensis]|uniref:ABC-2 family transporter protein n=1 Tax=Streptomyces aidingensis TaxID=910347 RepID=A0A1I1SUH9_9ACTN|nr:ABC transporter permease subunit [Streptomyces aidingensis]SFD50104.1 ABC-2 family transporter protein [Streptomyces aidingensis]
MTTPPPHPPQTPEAAPPPAQPPQGPPAPAAAPAAPAAAVPQPAGPPPQAQPQPQPQPPQSAPGYAAAPSYASPIPVQRTHLGHALASEWTKIRTVRSTIWTLVIMFLVVIGLSLIINAAVSSADDDSMPPLFPGFLGILFGQIAILTFGVLVASTEYTTGMIRPTLTASPRRGRILTAKVIVFGLIAFTSVAVALGLSLLLSLAIQGEGQGIDEMPGDAWLSGVLGTALYVTVLGLFGLGLGVLLRSSAGSITLMVGLILVPPIAASLLGIAESLRDFAEKLAEYSAPATLAALSFGYTDTELSSGWAQVGVAGALAAVALAGAYARLGLSDA